MLCFIQTCISKEEGILRHRQGSAANALAGGRRAEGGVVRGGVDTERNQETLQIRASALLLLGPGGRGREDAGEGAPLHLRGDEPEEDRLPRRRDGRAHRQDKRVNGQEGAGQGPSGMVKKLCPRLRDSAMGARWL